MNELVECIVGDQVSNKFSREVDFNSKTKRRENSIRVRIACGDRT